MLKHPAEFTVHTPTGPVHSCVKHARQLVRLDTSVKPFFWFCAKKAQKKRGAWGATPELTGLTRLYAAGPVGRRVVRQMVRRRTNE